MTNAPPVLLPYQQAWIADPAPVKVCEKSRRIGLSWAEAADDVLYSAADGGDDTWYIGYNRDMALEFIRDAADWARAYQLAASEIDEMVLDDEDKSILAFRVTFASGHRVTALSSRPANLRGKQGRVVIDEAAFHHDLPGLLKAALALLIWGGSVRVISTHNGDANPFNELVQDVRAGKKPYSLHRTDIDEALQQGLYGRICLKLGREWSAAAEAAWRAELFTLYGSTANEELLCIPAQGGGAYLPRQLIESRMVAGRPVLRFGVGAEFTLWPQEAREAEARDWCERELAPVLKRLDPQRNHFLGEDFGRTGDLTVFVPMEEGLDLVRRVPFMVELRNVPFEQQKQILFYLCDRLPRFGKGALDARGNGQYLAEVATQRYGERIVAVMLSAQWYRDHMPPFKAAFEDGGIELPRDALVLEDLRAITMDKGVAKVPDDARTHVGGEQRHGDAAIALALAHFASRQEVAVYGSHAVPKHGVMGADEDGDGDPTPRLIRRGAGFGLHRGAI
jgi:phage FluMu gp28-like protein